MTFRKKLIEVALPLETINDASAYDKMPGIGPHPKGIHHWWASLPLPTARAVLFASLVDDPSSDPAFDGKSEAEISAERKRLFGIIEGLCQKKAHEKNSAFRTAQDEIRRCCRDRLPVLLDPFCGGGAIPLEGQRLGLSVYASDLNPIAVLKTKATVEIVPKFADREPVNPRSRREKRYMLTEWKGSQGLAEDIRYYGEWIRNEMEKRIGHLYPRVTLPDGNDASIIAWLWARTVKCPNPACHAVVPLVRSFVVSKKGGRATWIEPIIDQVTKTLSFGVETGTREAPKGTMIKKRGALCPSCGSLISLEHIRSEGKNRQIGVMHLATVYKKNGGRGYLPPDASSERIANEAKPTWVPDFDLPENPRYMAPPLYGMTRFSDVFTSRQLFALETLSQLIMDARKKAFCDSLDAGMEQDGLSLCDGGIGATAYADAIVTFLGFALDRCVDFNNSLCRWVPSNEKVMNLFCRQAVPMVWDFSEANILGDSVGSWRTCVNYVTDCLETILVSSREIGVVKQLDASNSTWETDEVLLSTDPPYYDNIGYADLADFFYVWLRRSIGTLFPDLFSTVLTPKRQELVATPFRFEGDMQKASLHFEEGFRKAFSSLMPKLDMRFPVTIYYAFKQGESETDEEESSKVVSSTAWETMLESLLKTGFQVTSTWPVRASQKWRMVSMGTNALASYIVFSCRPRKTSAPLATRREFVSELKDQLPSALTRLQEGNIAPVDLAQASIGPGIAVFSKYSRVLEADGTTMSVRTALQLINSELEAYLNREEGEIDRDTQLLVDWFGQFGMEPGPFGDAETLSKAKNTSIEGIARDGLMSCKGGKVNINARGDLSKDWDPTKDIRLTLWECTQQLIKRYHEDGEMGAAELVTRLGVGKSEDAKRLAYRLYSICEKRGWVDEARAYNELVVAWPEIQRKAAAITGEGPQKRLST